ncbi:MAG: transposase [Caldilineaceae bacterium SB0666_bin_21]|nr:transposase [Caldilineaceae bacterium SB0666_bin_21]
MLIALYSVRSERACCEELAYNLPCHWFLDMDLRERSFDAVLGLSAHRWTQVCTCPTARPGSWHPARTVLRNPCFQWRRYRHPCSRR